MKEAYTPPKLEVTIFAPAERLMTLESLDGFEALNPDADVFNLRNLTNLSRSAGEPTISNEGDIFLPFW